MKLPFFQIKQKLGMQLLQKSMDINLSKVADYDKVNLLKIAQVSSKQSENQQTLESMSSNQDKQS